MPKNTESQKEPRLPALVALVAVAGLNAALPASRGVLVGPETGKDKTKGQSNSRGVGGSQVRFIVTARW